ncbi:MAG: hypothetical protein IMW89_17390 [Ktedonobacteraceae bacterium]|nr:hypothetical protein [Ktedonobacteraceae bacterium]
MRSATRVMVSTFGVLAGLAGIEHGIRERDGRLIESGGVRCFAAASDGNISNDDVVQIEQYRQALFFNIDRNS